MRLRVVAVGKLKQVGLRSLVDEYTLRVRRHVDLTEVEVRDDRALLKAFDPHDRNGALEVLGAAHSSRELAVELQGQLARAPRVSLFIGGAEGLPTELIERVQFKWSLSRLTLPHRLARVLLFEQLYRATTIWRGEPYAKED